MTRSMTRFTKYMTERNGHQIGILDHLLKYRQPQEYIHLKKKKQH